MNIHPIVNPVPMEYTIAAKQSCVVKAGESEKGELAETNPNGKVPSHKTPARGES